jgi:hypothetical protein
MILRASDSLTPGMIPSDHAGTSPQSTSLQGGASSRARREFDGSALDSGPANWLPGLVLGAGFAARLYEAWAYFLNPDEALHYLLASQTSLVLAYNAALTNAHPPLLILVLYYWRSLGQSELMLRMPSVLAGTACCWLAYLWLKDVTDRSTAFIGLVLFAFAPALINLSAEVRQYGLLFFFMSGCLYLSERAIREDSWPWMVLFTLSLYGALLIHYASLLFAFTMGIYMLTRLYPYKKRLRLVAVWGAGQIGGLALSTYFVMTHVARYRQAGLLQADYDSYLRKYVFHPGESNAGSFAAVGTLRVFTYLFSNGVVGSLALLAFLAGMFLLLRGRTRLNKDGPSPRQLALLFGLAFAANCGAALAGLYPYGGTRHAASLLLFVGSGASIGLAWVARARRWVTALGIGIALVVCHVFPAPPPPIRPRNHARPLMKAAVDSFRQSAPPGSVVVADYQSGLLFAYYVCGHGMAQMVSPLLAFAKTDCGPYTVITTGPEEWKFSADDFPGQLADIARTYNLALGSRLWMFHAGWIADSAPALRRQLQQLGCSTPQSFGENILLCEFAVGTISDLPMRLAQ